MKFPLYSFTEKENLGDIEVDVSTIDSIDFDKKFVSMHINRMKAAHCGQRNAKTKNLSEVSGTTAKPFKQKGTGRARQGTKRAPHYRGGSVAFGPRGGFRFIKIPKGEVRLAKRHILSLFLKNNTFFVVSDIALPTQKTKNFVKSMKNFDEGIVDGRKKFLILFDGQLDNSNIRSSSNLRCVKYANISNFTTNDLVRADIVLISKDAAQNLSKCLK